MAVAQAEYDRQVQLLTDVGGGATLIRRSEQEMWRRRESNWKDGVGYPNLAKLVAPDFKRSLHWLDLTGCSVFFVEINRLVDTEPELLPETL